MYKMMALDLALELDSHTNTICKSNILFLVNNYKVQTFKSYDINHNNKLF